MSGPVFSTFIWGASSGVWLCVLIDRIHNKASGRSSAAAMVVFSVLMASLAMAAA